MVRRLPDCSNRVNVFYIGVSQDETWGAANVAPCHVKLNVA